MVQPGKKIIRKAKKGAGTASNKAATNDSKNHAGLSAAAAAHLNHTSTPASASRGNHSKFSQPAGGFSQAALGISQSSRIIPGTAHASGSVSTKSSNAMKNYSST